MIGSEDQVADSLAALKSAAPYIRTLISRGLRIRRVPALHFAVDATGLRGARIQQLLGSIANGSQPPADLSDLPTPTARDTEHHE